MSLNNLMPSREKAENILLWANEKNPGLWIGHCKATAIAAETIALKGGLDPEKAYILGLLHDIGYHGYENGKGTTCHIYFGYDLMMEKGYETVAKICLTHSFPAVQDINTYSGFDMYCSNDEKAFISSFLLETIYDDYDKLIQLCDCLGTPHGITTIEKRNVEGVMRKGFNVNTLKNWTSYFEQKDYFDEKCGINIYNLFYDEIKSSIFGSQVFSSVTTP